MYLGTLMQALPLLHPQVGKHQLKKAEPKAKSTFNQIKFQSRAKANSIALIIAITYGTTKFDIK